MQRTDFFDVSTADPPLPRVEHDTHVVAPNAIDQEQQRIDLMNELKAPVGPIFGGCEEIQAKLDVSGSQSVRDLPQPIDMELEILMKRALITRRSDGRKATIRIERCTDFEQHA